MGIVAHVTTAVTVKTVIIVTGVHVKMNNIKTWYYLKCFKNR